MMETPNHSLNRPLKILLVPEHPEAAAQIEALLRTSGLACTFSQARTLEAFRFEVEMGIPDVILSEASLPGYSVRDALQWLQRNQPGIPLIVLANGATDSVARECVVSGAEDYVTRQGLARLPTALRNAVAKSKAERAKAAAETQCRLITENTRDLISLLDRNLQVLYTSPSFNRILGHKTEALFAIPFLSLIHHEDLPEVEKCVQSARLFHQARNVELRLCHASGTWLECQATISLIQDSDGASDQVLVVSRDISDRKLAEKEIRKLAAFARLNPNPVMELAAGGSLTYFNEAALALARALKKEHPKDILPLNAASTVKHCLASGNPQAHVEAHIQGRWLQWSFYPIQDHQVVHAYAEDITDQRQLEASMRQAQKMESIGQLAAGVAHDFNNILTVIQGHANLLRSDPGLGEVLTHSVQQISRAAERACGLTRQLLMFSRKKVLQPQLIDLNELITSVLKMLRSMLGERITLHRDLAASLPPIFADPGMIEQVLVNLVVNARDAIAQGGTITLRTQYQPLDEAGVHGRPNARAGAFVSLAVTDTGHGMDEATKARIFEPFFTTKEAGRGTGLGLATVHSIVHQHEGWIEVDSQSGQGATFRVFIPASTRELRKTDPHLESSAPGGHETILIVEDEAPLRELMHEILHKKGYRILEAPNGVQALEVWRHHKEQIDLLLTDMMMPDGLSGRELANRIASEKSGLKVLFTSGYSLDVIEPGFSVHLGQSFLQKPYHPETLARAVRDCLNSELATAG